MTPPQAFLLLAPCLLPIAPATPADGPPVRWKGEVHRPDDLPEELTAPPRAAIEAWVPWSEERRYELNLSPDARVLLVTRQGDRRRGRRMDLVERTAEVFDALLPAPPRDTPQPQQPRPNGDGQSYEYSWGSAIWPVDTETCVMFVVRNEADYESLVEELGTKNQYLEAWVPRGKKTTGFVHQMPLTAAYIENAAGMEEWDPDNELVHRIAQLLFVRRFSAQQPFWLTRGVTWHVEREVRGAIYCFPYRSGFVWATEHRSWELDLRRRFSREQAEPPTVEELAAWPRGTYHDEAAKLSWGLVDYIAREHREELTPFVEALRLHALEGSRVDLGGGSWKLVPDYTIPADEQRDLLHQHLGEDFLEKAAAFFREGR